MDLGCLLEIVRNDKNDNKFAFTAPLCCSKFVLYLYTKMCTDLLYKPLGRNFCTKVTFSFSSLQSVVSFYICGRGPTGWKTH